MIITPTIIQKDSKGREFGSDIYSLLLEKRIIILQGEINDDLATSIIAQLQYLEFADPKKDITLEINSPGGSIHSGMAIYDTMKYIKCDVSTICIGMAASMGAFLLAGGTKGKRFALPNSEIMIHQPLGGTEGQVSDMLIEAEHIKDIKHRMNTMLSDFTGKSYNQLVKDTDRNNWMTAEEAQKYGLVDKVITKH